LNDREGDLIVDFFRRGYSTVPIPSSSTLVGSSTLCRLLQRRKTRPRRRARRATPPIAVPAIAPAGTDAPELWAPWAVESVPEEGLEATTPLMDGASVGMPVVAAFVAVPIIIAEKVVAADVAVAGTVAVDMVVGDPVAADVGPQHGGDSCVKAQEPWMMLVGSCALEPGVVGSGLFGASALD
jgi:hypothetical protein